MDTVDNRKSHRNRMLQGGKIVFGRSAMLIDCTIRDRSEEGARLKVTNAGDVPNQIRLFAMGENTVTSARVIWRSEREVGIEFTDKPENIQDSADPKIRALRVHA